MGKVIPIFKAESYFIPLSKLAEGDAQSAFERFTYRFYDQKGCAKCDNLSDRHNDICDACSFFKGSKRTAKAVRRQGHDFLSLPGGASKKIKKWLISRGYDGKYKVHNHREGGEPFRRPIKFLRDTYDYQDEAVEVLLKKKRGILESPPRSGKTVMGAKLICKVGKKTLILAHQREWLLNFQETFIGSATEKAFTNCRPSQIKICTSEKDFLETDICLSSFAKFMSKKGKALLKKIKDLFEVVMVDEVHGLPALQTSRVASQFNAPYFFGLSGTVERKMEDEILIAHDIVGPVIHSCEVTRLVPRIRTIQPNVKLKDPKKGSPGGYTYFQTRLESSAERRRYIIKEVIRHARDGHLVLVPLSRVDSVLRWVTEINRETESPGFALPFFGGLKKDKRKEILYKARNYECRVLVGIIGLMSTGINIPRASCIVEMGPTNNTPKCDQRVSRILTPMEGKPNPLILLTLDDSDLVMKCRRNEWYNCILPRFNPKISNEERAILSSYFSGRGTHPSLINLNEGV